MAVNENATRKLNELDEALDIQNDDLLYLVRYPFTVLTSYKLPYGSLKAALLAEIGGADVTGPATSLAGNIVLFGSGNGKLLEDSGFNPAYFVNRNNHFGQQAWSTINATPTTLAGYGITDAGGPVSISDEAVLLTAGAASINFVGAGVTATAIGNAVTVTIAGGGNMVLAGVQTITGAKTFENATLKVNNVPNTFATTLASVATAARTLTLPDATGTLSTLAGVETLTNKTLVAPVLNLGGDAPGDMYYRSGGLLTRIPMGAPYQTLTASPAGVPTWSNAGFRLLGTVTGLNLNLVGASDIGTIVPLSSNYIPTMFVVYAATAAANPVSLGVFTGANGTGITVVSPVTLGSINGPGEFQVLAVAALNAPLNTSLFVRRTTAAAAAATVSVAMYGISLS
jgi:hypothetical protein